MIEVIKFVPWEEHEDYEENMFGGMGGWFDRGNRWQDYLDVWREDIWKYAEALRRRVLKDKIRKGGFWHEEEGVPLFSDNTVATFSMRGWGDFMAAVYSEEDNKDYWYGDFAWYTEEE